MQMFTPGNHGRPETIQLPMMFWSFIFRNLNTKKLLSLLGVLCLLVVVFDFIMLTKQRGYYLSRNYRTLETTSHIFSDKLNSGSKTAVTHDNLNRTRNKNLTESTGHLKNVSELQSRISNIITILKQSFQKNRTISSVPVKTNDSVHLQNCIDCRPDNCTDCFKHNFSFVLNNAKICKTLSGNAKQEVTILILIFTSHARRKQRDAIRETWLTYSKNNTSNVRYAFLLGLTNNTDLNQAVLEENKQHADLIQENFTDSYFNLTYKTMMGFKWATSHCAHAQFVLKTDDDMYVNVPVLVNLTRTNAERLQSAVGGNCYLSNQRPIRDKYSKWYASNVSYPQDFYPGFCSGTGYVTSIKVVQKVFNISKDVPFFHLEDIYVSLCLKKLGYTLLPLYGFHNHRVRINYCNYKSAFVVTSHEVSPDLLRSIWTKNCKPYRLGMRILGFVVAITFFFMLCLCSMVQ
ncbi:beta-1,3-galactosyltransferase 5-like [Pecten maximus]|uniref:beta-1,3-galactosyltransferase 5-like n=1 Tax=Pecten maximus TaxID=6579 RepID=UPI001458EDA5|nr:beta-1,3-galactosyltransferase 5-like [Pecten maximus]XP_033758942.1 beta-1,3-galactosyltransferase 5-like [Pecten maximus]XP_033758943.1 beta-1,3-galactosyltransferase 5-like [Pecten maximus]XP_033758944.1 beta-1,3-galactosyltransferase 5-like [Pecten maximus]